MQRSARAAEAASHPNGRRVVAADSSGYSDGERQTLQAAKLEHQRSTAVVRSALKVVNQTTDVACQTLERMYHQGAQLQRAAHGIEEIDENVQHAGRIISFMSRFCCCRSDKHDPDVERERHMQMAVERQRMAGVVAATSVSAGYAAKRELVGGVVAAKLAALEPPADAAAARAAADAAAASGREPWSELIAAQPGPLGRERAKGHGSMPLLGQGLEEHDLKEIQLQTAKQDGYLDQISHAVDALHAMGTAMGQELEEQAPRLDGLQQRTEATGEGLRTVAWGAAKLAGRASRRQDSRGTWRGDQEAAGQAVQRAVARTAPMAVRYGRR